MAYSDSFPATRPVFQADFANGGRVDPRITFSRSDTPPTYAAPSAVHYWSNEKHLSSENLILHSNGFDSSFAGTGTGRLSATAGQSDPAGGTNAWQLSQQTGQTVAGNLNFTLSGLTVGQEYTWSIYVKNDGRTAPLLTENFNVGSTQRHTWFDTSSTGTVGTSNAAHTPLITKLGDWFRITIRFTADVTSGYVWLYIASTDNSTTVADDGNGFYAYGASLSSTGQLVHEDTIGQIARSYAPTLKSVSTAGQPRFEYSPTDSASMGLLVEGQAQNLIGYGSSIGNWSSSRAAVTDNAAIAPNGELKADLMIQSYATGVDGSHFRYPPSVSVTSGTAYTTSVYVKSAGHRYVQLAGGSGGFASQYVNFDLNTATLSATGSGCSGAISSVGNGWYRITATMTAEATASAGPIIALVESLSSGRFATFVGDDYSGVLLWGAQFEASSFASSLVDTGTGSSALTRAADSASVATADIGYTGGAMTLVTDTTVSDPTSSDYRAAAMVFSDSDRAAIWATSADNRIARVETNGVGGNVGTNSGVNGKAALSINTNDIAVCLNGGAVATDTSHALADFGSATLYIGNNNSAYHLNGHIKRLAVFGEALSDTNLISLTK